MPLFFYCSKSSAEAQRSDPTILMRTLLRQAITSSPEIPMRIRARYESRKNDGAMSFEEAVRFMTDVSNEHEITYILIDALDECNKETRAELLDALQYLLQESSTLIKIFVASRNNHDLLDVLKDYPQIRIEGSKNQTDIDKFVERKVDDCIDRRPRKLLRTVDVPNSLREKIKRALRDGAQSMYVPFILYVPFLDSWCLYPDGSIHTAYANGSLNLGSDGWSCSCSIFVT